MKMDLEQLLRQAWNSGMGSYHDTKTSKQLKDEENDFIDSMEDELNLFSIPNVNNRYSIEDIERCVENWGMCKVEKEYIERFLNGC